MPAGYGAALVRRKQYFTQRETSHANWLYSKPIHVQAWRLALMALVAFAGLIRHAAGQTQYTIIPRDTSSFRQFYPEWLYLVSTPRFPILASFLVRIGQSQIPDRGTGSSGDEEAVPMHAPWSLGRLWSVLQYSVLLVEDDAVVQLRHIVGWIIGPIDVAPLSD